MPEDFLATIDWDALKRGAVAQHACTDCGAGNNRPGLCDRCADRRRERRQEEKRQLASIPPRYRDASEHLADRVADQRAISLVETALDHHTVVLLLGVAGAGKSTLAAHMLTRAAKAGRSVWWSPALKLAQARAEARLGTEPEDVRRAIRADVVVVDDLGQEAVSTWSAVVDVIHGRHDAGRPLVVTTGLQKRALAERYGGGTGRRLMERALSIDVAARRA